MYTDEQIEAKAREIGARNYHPIGTFIPGVNTGGISIRQELMRTAMGEVDASAPEGYFLHKAKSASNYTNALLLQMAKDELGVSNE